VDAFINVRPTGPSSELSALEVAPLDELLLLDAAELGVEKSAVVVAASAAALVLA
jgi:hypothetical protein